MLHRIAKVAIWRWRIISIIGLIILLGFGVRLLALEKPSLSFDEALSVSRAEAAKALPQFVHIVIYEDLHPFLFYISLHGWEAVAGKSEFSLRFLSVLLGTLLIPATYATAVELFHGSPQARRASSAVGLMAAALVAFSPFLVRYSRETRGYMMSAVLTSLALLALLRAVRSGGRWWLVYAVLVALSWYTHYFAAFVLPACLVFAVLMGRATLRRWLGATALAVLLFLPWLWPMVLQLQRLINVPDFFPDRLDLPTIMTMFIQNLVPGQGPTSLIGAGLIVIALGAGVLVLVGQSQIVKRGALVFLAWILPVMLTITIVALVPKFAQRYIITAIAPLLLSLSLALFLVLWRWRRVGRGVYLLTLTITILVFLGQSTVAAMQGDLAEGDDPRSLAEFLRTQTTAQDVLLLIEDAPHIFEYYDPGPAQIVGAHIGTDLASGMGVLNQVFERRPRRIWLVLWHEVWADPGDFALTELMRRGQVIVSTDRFTNYRLWGFDMMDYRPIVLQPQPQVALDATFGDVASVVGYDLIDHDPGVLRVILYWRKLRPGQGPYMATLSLEDEEGNRYVVAEQPLATWTYTPDKWPEGQIIRVRLDVPLPPDLAPRAYRTWLWLWDVSADKALQVTHSGGPAERWRVQLPDHLVAKVQDSRTPLANPRGPAYTFANGLRLLGYDLARPDGLQVDRLMLTLWWQVVQDSAYPVTLRVRVLAPDGRLAYTSERQVIAAYSLGRTSSAVEANRSAYLFSLPVEIGHQDHTYTLQVGIGDEWIRLDGVYIPPLARRFDVPTDAQPLDVDFDGLVRLAGYRIEPGEVRPGGALTVTLYWRSEKELNEGYHVTTQLLADGEKVAQHDAVPRGGSRPTTGWLPGEVVVDVHTMSIPEGLVAGRYEILVALYTDTRRLPTGPDRDHVLLPVGHD